MQCNRVRNNLSAFSDRELTGEEMLQIRRHLDGCSECSRELEQVRMVRGMLTRMRAVEPPAEFSLERALAARQATDSLHLAADVEAGFRNTLRVRVREWFQDQVFHGRPSMALAASVICASFVLGVASRFDRSDTNPASVTAGATPEVSAHQMNAETGMPFVASRTPYSGSGFAHSGRFQSVGFSASPASHSPWERRTGWIPGPGYLLPSE